MPRPEVPPGSVEQLDRTVDLLMEFTRERYVAASVLVNPLLVVWDAAHAVGVDVAAPVEALLTVAVQRSTIAADEIRGCVQEARALAVQEAVLSEPVRG